LNLRPLGYEQNETREPRGSLLAWIRTFPQVSGHFSVRLCPGTSADVCHCLPT
jgi:hypothetical protein